MMRINETNCICRDSYFGDNI